MNIGSVNIRNLTPHSVEYVNVRTGRFLTIPADELCVRIETDSPTIQFIDGLEIKTQNRGEVVELPEPMPNTLLIVSNFVLNQLRRENSPRTDVVSPGTGPRDNVLRDDNNRVKAVTCFQSLNEIDLSTEALAA